MAHNQEMLTHNKTRWGENVRIIGLSIDTDMEHLREKIKAKGWTDVEHYNVKLDVCHADKDYGLSGIPHVVLVDKSGKIVFKGHPSERKSLEADINALLADEQIVVVPPSESRVPTFIFWFVVCLFIYYRFG